MVCAINVSGKPLMHAFSISSSPTENYLEFTKKFTPHEYSVALQALKPGDKATIDAPYHPLLRRQTTPHQYCSVLWVP
jgi:ferredoxin-NADP reductase